jgi:integrase
VNGQRKRRSHGEGSIYRRASDGRWVGMLDLGWVDGKRRRRPVYGRSETEVRRKLAQLREQANRGVDLTAHPRTLAEWLDEWLTDIKAHDGTRPSTLARYEIAIRCHLVPMLGKIRLDRLTPADVRRLLAERRDQMSPASLVKLHAVLRNALEDAVRNDLVPRNVAKAVRGSSLERKERRVLTVKEARQLLVEILKDRLAALFLIALLMGLRRGEVLGLRWSDVHLEARVLYVRRAIQRVSGTLQLVDVKTHRSARALPIPHSVLTALERHRAQQAKTRLAAGEAWQDLDLVFCTAIGTPLEPRNINRRWTQLRERAGHSWVRMHDLRHAFATFLLAEGTETRTAMDLMGHSTIRLMDTYAHSCRIACGPRPTRSTVLWACE